MVWLARTQVTSRRLDWVAARDGIGGTDFVSNPEFWGTYQASYEKCNDPVLVMEAFYAGNSE